MRLAPTAIGFAITVTIAVAQPVSKPRSEGDFNSAHGATSAPPPPQAAERILTCDGLFGPAATHAKMTEAFGPQNVVYDKQEDGAEGETYMATVLFKKSAAERLVITWSDAKRQMKPGSLTVKALAGPPGSHWHLPNGLHAGSTLEEVEAANGKPFALSGFDWDYGGYATDWKGGSLAKKVGPCTVSIRFNPGRGVNTDQVSGEKTFLSSDPKMRAAKPFLSVLALSPE